MDIHSCDHCQKIVLRVATNEPRLFPQLHMLSITYERKTVLKVTKNDSLEHVQFSSADIIQAVHDQCLLFVDLITPTKEREMEEFLADAIFQYRWDFRHDKWWLKLSLKNDLRHLKHYYQLFGLHGINQSVPAAFLNELSFPGKKSINVNPDSPETYRLARAWIEECVTEHAHSSDPKEATLPLRLLQIVSIVDTYDLCLVKTSQPTSHKNYQFVALSYCWGGVQHHKTTKSSLESNRDAIQFGLLPKTIQDAIRVTSKLGYSYLWVDSLCIVQDDEEELQSEIAKMPDVYSGAIVTIAASSAASAAEGFLQPRTMDEEFAGELKVQYLDGFTAKMGVLKSTREQLFDRNQPLDSRSWALQEHVLSTRILQYRHRQLRFLCPISTREPKASTACYTDGWTNSSHCSLILPKVDPQAGGSDNLSRFENFWYSTIAAYSTRRLTCPADKVLAISGIATRLQEFNGEKVYVAGHWIDSTSSTLLWYVLSRDTFDRGYHRTHLDPDWLGPSWAWTSVAGQICFVNASDIQRKKGQENWTTTLEHRVLVDQKAPFGAVREAVLGITARACCVRLRCQPYKHIYRYKVSEEDIPVQFTNHCIIFVDNRSGICDRAMLDGPVYLVFATINTNMEYFTGGSIDIASAGQGLVLVGLPEREDGVKRRFERHGMFKIRYGYDFDQIKKWGEETGPLLLDWLNSAEEAYFEVQ